MIEENITRQMNILALKKAKEIDTKKYSFVKDMDILQYKNFRDKINNEADTIANLKIMQCIPNKRETLEGDVLVKMLFEKSDTVLEEIAKYGFNQYRKELFNNMFKNGIWKKRV